MQRKQYKIDLIGPAEAGKTSIVNKLVNDNFDTEYSATVGIPGEEYYNNTILRAHGNNTIARSVLQNSLNDTDAFILVLDGSKTYVDQQSDIDDYLRIVKNKNEGRIPSNHIKFYVIINKSDVNQQFQDDIKNQLQLVAGRDFGLTIDDSNVFHCSAKKGNGIKELFDKIENDLSASNKKEAKLKEAAPISPEPKEKGAGFLQSIRDAFEPVIDHPYWAGGNGLIAVGAVTLFALAAFTAGSFLTFGILPSAFLGAAIITGAALVAWNAICYGIDKYQKPTRQVIVDLPPDYQENGMKGLGGRIPDINKELANTHDQGRSPVSLGTSPNVTEKDAASLENIQPVVVEDPYKLK